MGGGVTCASCGEENRTRARFCDHCGAELRQPADSRPGGNRIVTILHVDLAGSTRMGERLSLEAVPEVINSFYEVVDKAVAKHGGAVENHMGDGVLAVFGKPEPRVDDALRAVRAALAVHDAMPTFNQQVAQWGVDLRTHSAVNTGEVSLAVLLSGEDRGRDVTLGDPANVCAKLNEEARDGQILIGEATWELVRDDVRVDSGEPLTLRLKGREAPVRAWGVLGVEPEGSRSPTPETRMVGRERHMAQLRLYYERVVADRCCVLVTVLGPAGIGKSRLVDEFVRSVAKDDCLVLEGHCLPFGDAITSRPIEQMLRTAAEILPGDDLEVTEQKLLQVITTPEQPADDLRRAADQRVTALVARVLHPRHEPSDEPEDRLSALQQFFERMAERQPLIMVVDGLHDAETPLVEFIERLAGSLSDARVLLLCMARAEFFERRGASGMSLLEAASMLLKPLDREQAEEVIRQLLQPEPPPEVLDAVRRAAGGNPLQLRELVTMLVEQGRLQHHEGGWRIVGDLSELSTPPRIEAVLGARLGRLDAAGKLVVERAAVVGERFSEADVAALLTPELSREQVRTALRELVRRELVHRDRDVHATAQDVDGYLFRHALIQNSAYRRMDRETRAELHARYARWLQTRALLPEGRFHYESAQTEEQVGYHFASAYQELLALRKREDPTTRHLARQAGEHLARAGHLHAIQAALLRVGERPLRRALALLPQDHPERLSAWLDLADVLRDHEPAAAEREYTQVIAAAGAAGDQRVELHALLGRIEAQWIQHPLEGPEVLRGQLDDAIREFERLQDAVGLANAYRLRANVDYSRGLSQRALQDVEHALKLAEGNDERLAAKSTQLYCVILFWGPTPLTEVRSKVEERLGWARARKLRSLEAFALTLLARIAVLQGDAPQARRLLAESKMVVPLGPRRHSERRRAAPVAELLTGAAVTLSEALVEIGAGDLPAAERVLTDSYEALEREGKDVPRANVVALLARVMWLQGRDEEAEQLSEQCRRLALKYQLDAQVKWRSVLALVLARQGRLEEAERLADEAVRLSRRSEQLSTQAEALLDQAVVLQLAGKTDEGARAAREAAKLYEAKGSTVSAANAWDLLQGLEAA